jgi:hypothetical protein
MKNILPAILISFVFSSCELFIPQEDEKEAQEDSLVTLVVDTIPHTVRKGKPETYGFAPDTALHSLVIGSPESFKRFWLENGAEMRLFEKNRWIALYETFRGGEWMTVYITKDKKHREVAYGAIVQKSDTNSPPPPPGTPQELSKSRILTGHQIYIGMSPDFVLSVYRDQALTQWQRGDTLYLEYKPQGKDAGYYKRFNWQSYTATYKFVNNKLRRIEYFTDPAELETR